MVERTSWPEPSKSAKMIGMLFVGLCVLTLAYLMLRIVLRVNWQPGAVPIIVIELAVGIAYLAGRVHPMVRVVPSVLWIVVVVVSFLLPGSSDSTHGGAVKMLCAVVLICALAYHAYVDVRVLLARHRAGSAG